MRLISSIADLEEGVAQLTSREAQFAIAAQEGLPPLRRTTANFAALAHILIEQMISRRAAEAIIKRVELEFGRLDAHELQNSDILQLRRLGLTMAKARAIKSIAQSIAKGSFDLQSLGEMEDSQALAALMSHPGVGPWTANVYLLTALGRGDAWPAGDVALQSAAQSLFRLDSRPSARMMDEIAEAWRPWRSVAARLLWMHYRKVMGSGKVKANPLALFTASLHKI